MHTLCTMSRDDFMQKIKKVLQFSVFINTMNYPRE